MLPQISATAFFCFGLTVLCVGYLFVEILFGDNYFLKKSLERNNRSLFDRILHYLTRGIIINFVFVMFGAISGMNYDIANVFNSTAGIAQLFAIKSTNGIDMTYAIPAQIIIFSVYYFFLLTFIIILGFGSAKLGLYLGSLTRKKIKKRKN